MYRHYKNEFAHAPSIGMALRRRESCCMAAQTSELVMTPRRLKADRRAASKPTLLNTNDGASPESFTNLH